MSESNNDIFVILFIFHSFYVFMLFLSLWENAYIVDDGNKKKKKRLLKTKIYKND